MGGGGGKEIPVARLARGAKAGVLGESGRCVTRLGVGW